MSPTPGEFALCDLTRNDIPTLLSLNNQHVLETSLLDTEGMSRLLDMAFYARGVEAGGAAFLIALDHTAPYRNENFRWFQEHFDSFLYIDRVIVAESARGRGLAASLYRDLFAGATRAGHERVVCEVNTRPPNPASQAFHVKMGFSKVGEAMIHDGAKTVEYLSKSVS